MIPSSIMIPSSAGSALRTGRSGMAQKRPVTLRLQLAMSLRSDGPVVENAVYGGPTARHRTRPRSCLVEMGPCVCDDGIGAFDHRLKIVFQHVDEGLEVNAPAAQGIDKVKIATRSCQVWMELTVGPGGTPRHIRISPRPAARAMPPSMRKGMSEPSSAAIWRSCSAGKGFP